MIIKENFCMTPRGFVRPSLIDSATGRRIPFDRRHNQLSYMSAEAMAAAFGGDPSYIPAQIGFIYGSSAGIPIDETISRRQSWEDLKRELETARETSDVDIQVVGFSYSPSLGGEQPQHDSSSSGSSGSDSGEEQGDYAHIKPTGANAITFHAVSNSQDPGVFGTSFVTKDNVAPYIYQAVLLAFHEGRHYIISRASMKDGSVYRQKPDGFEIALDWTIVFR